MWQDTGFYQDDQPDTAASMQLLENLLVSVPAGYRNLSPDALLTPPAPGKWSRQQVLGHLIDSAINNLKRFTDIQLAEEAYQVQVYRQDGLVAVNHYQDLPLEHLLNLWEALNRQIILVVNRIPPDKLGYELAPQYQQTGTKTLGWLICDYVAHMLHHFRATGLVV